MTASPTAPRPHTATVVPGLTTGLIIAAPQPVLTPQPRTQHLFMSAVGLILAADMAAITVYSEKVLHPIKWKMDFPSLVNLEVPSGISPLP